MGNKCCKKGGASGAEGHVCAHGQGSNSLIQDIKDESEFSAVLKNPSNEGKIIVAEFYAPWCGPCQKIGPQVETLAQEFANAVFVKINVDECDELALSYAVSSMPRFVILKNGEQVDGFDGADEVKLRQLLVQHTTSK